MEKTEVKTSRLYRFLRHVWRIFSHKMAVHWAEPFPGGAGIFVCNHVGALGPIDMCAHFEPHENCRIWCNEGIMNKETVPAYVRQDYWWQPGCRLEKVYDAILPNLAAHILPPILQGGPTMPVYHDGRMAKTMRESLRHLEGGGQIVIFPEQPSGHGSHYTWLNTGWMAILSMYFKRTGKNVPMYPVHIDTKQHTFNVSKPVTMDEGRPLEEQKEELSQILHREINGEKA